MSQVAPEAQLKKDIAKRLNRHRVIGQNGNLVGCSCDGQWRTHRAHTEHPAEDAFIPARAAVRRHQTMLEVERKNRKDHESRKA